MIRYTPEQADTIDFMLENDGIVLVKAGAGCVDKDTQFLTSSGWKYISDYKTTDLVAEWDREGNISFKKPSNYIKLEAQILNHIKSDTVDMVLCDDHKVPYITESGNFKTKQFNEIKNFSKLKIPRTYNNIISNSSFDCSDELIRVLVMQSVDGSEIKNIKKFKIRIQVKKQRKKERVIKLLNEANIDFYLQENSNGYQVITYYPPSEIAFKGLDPLWSCNTRQLKIVGEEVSYWNSANTERKNVSSLRFTGNKKDAELVQHAWHILTGNYVTIVKDPRSYKKEDLYNVLASNRKFSDLTFKSSRNRKISTIAPYRTADGYKYCFTTSTGFWLARRNGKVFPTGNCGKSFLSRQIVKELKPKSGIYTAFNKAIVEEGKNKFRNTPIECKTFHALAYQYVKPKIPIQALTYKCITEKIIYSEKRNVIATIDDFFVSDSTDMYTYFEQKFEKHPRKDLMINLCTKYIEGMLEGTVNPTFNFMLKCLHLMLFEEKVKITTDIIILDEINDVTAVSLEIFKLIDAPKKLGLGEPHQAIYQFLNLVDGFDALKDVATTLKLTKSYRCSIDIANRISSKMSKHLCKDFDFKGTDKPVTNGLTLYCTGTNASIVLEIYKRLNDNKSFTLLRKPSDIFAAPMAVLSASQGKTPYQKQYEFLVDLYEDFKAQSKHANYFKFLSSELDDEEINNAVRLLTFLSQNKVNLFQLYNDTKKIIPDKQYTISTVFTSKGLEFENVIIAADLNVMFYKAIDGKVDSQTAITNKRCYYVACSRAGNKLINSVL